MEQTISSDKIMSILLELYEDQTGVKYEFEKISPEEANEKTA